MHQLQCTKGEAIHALVPVPCNTQNTNPNANANAPPPSTSLRHPEQVLSRRRRMLMDMVDGFELEVRDGDTNALIRRMSN